MEAASTDVKNDVLKAEKEMRGHGAVANSTVEGKRTANRKLIYIGIVILVIMAGVAFSYLNGEPTYSALAEFDNSPVNATVLSQLSNIANNATLAAKVGVGLVSSSPVRAGSNLTPLTFNGTPAIVYIGAEFCPYCAVTRWGVVLALMRFGTFTSLHYMTSSASDVYASSPTFTFYNSTYSSNVVSLVSVEETTNQPANYSSGLDGYEVLQTPTAFENQLFNQVDLNNPNEPDKGGIPFIDFGNISVQGGAPIDPQVVYQHTWQGVIANLTDVNTTQSLSIIGAANVFTAQICAMTHDKPANVCDAPYLKSIAV
jgi:hypothetical protein